jgi:energy-coupling factor transporter transmembrane protein EcfT
LQGLGFSIGVASNLLPDLRQSSTNAWHSLRMRGGLRANWWRGIQLLLLTVLSNALRHAEEIVLAAEVRAFRPELSRKISLRIGTLDWWLVTGALSLLGLTLLF